MIYSVTGNIYAIRLGLQHAATITVNVQAESKEDAIEIGYDKLRDYCRILEKRYREKFRFNCISIKLKETCLKLS